MKKLGIIGAAVIVGIALVLFLGRSISRIPHPQREKLADCTSDLVTFQMTVHYDPPYQFLLGLPHQRDAPLDFDGEIKLSQGTSTVARIPITSRKITHCNWLDGHGGLDAQILTWGRTNHGERLEHIVDRGETYDVTVSFTQAPPTNSSIWWSSIAKHSDLRPKPNQSVETNALHGWQRS